MQRPEDSAQSPKNLPNNNRGLFTFCLNTIFVFEMFRFYHEVHKGHEIRNLKLFVEIFVFFVVHKKSWLIRKQLPKGKK